MTTSPIDPDIQRLLAIVHDVTQPRVTSMTPAEARDWTRSMRRPPRSRIEIPLVVDRTIPGPAGPLPIRIYHPEPTETRPVVIHLHGGGWVIGSVAEWDPIARRLARDLDAVVVSVEYRLAPEHPFPSAVDDAITATRWILNHAADMGGDPERVVVGGDSAGANLAAATTIALRDADGPRPAGQYLVYPVTDADFTRESMIEHARGKLLETVDMGWFWDHYCPNLDERRDWRASPLRADDLADLPAAVVALAGHDPLFDEGRDYAARLAEAGVPVTTHIAETLVHGYLGLTEASAGADTAFTEVTRMIGRLLRD